MDARLLLLPIGCLTAAAPVYATVYLSVEQAQALMLPGVKLVPDFRTLSEQQQQAVAQAADVSHGGSHEVQAWHSDDGRWFIVDQVVGKHLPIRYAVSIDASGAISQVEILEYNEAYGGEVRLPAWRRQFIGKRSTDQVQIEHNIQNVSGATLSCRHVTEGIRRLLAVHALILSRDTHD